MRPMDLVDSEPAPGVQEELSRFGRRLVHTEGCQQAQELEIHEMRHVVDKENCTEMKKPFEGDMKGVLGAVPTDCDTWSDGSDDSKEKSELEKETTYEEVCTEVKNLHLSAKLLVGSDLRVT
ncbi:unnamed protein product [Cladocopium goreaui]|uniref:Uncharacterized protein n=1 Tax=Cladocopium goreaui TaxID=2562237 RepID=A0A9P1GLT6_9DINO|nr:unnamed protein product [Cladocopium goreaui]